MAKPGRMLTVAEAREIAKAGGEVWLDLTEYNPCNDDYSGPARFSLGRISKDNDETFFLIGESVHTDIDFDEMGRDHDFARTSWPEGELELSECVE